MARSGDLSSMHLHQQSLSMKRINMSMYSLFVVWLSNTFYLIVLILPNTEMDNFNAKGFKNSLRKFLQRAFHLIYMQLVWFTNCKTFSGLLLIKQPCTHNFYFESINCFMSCVLSVALLLFFSTTTNDHYFALILRH